MSKTLPGHDQETIITFNNEEETAYIFTYDRAWQRHMEKRLGLQPTMNNGSGGKEYQIDKKYILMPRATRKPSNPARKRQPRSLRRSRVLRTEKLFHMSPTGLQRKNNGDSLPLIKKEVVSALLRH